MTARGYRPLFATGLARSGSTLLCRMLSAHPDALVAADPYLPLFRSLRNAIVRTRATPATAAGFDPDGPFQDYYFRAQGLAVLDTIQAADLDVPYDAGETPALLERARRRAADECPDLVPYLDDLPAPTYRAMFDRALALIARVRRAEDRRLVGFKEVWTVEFCAPLARAYPDARFVVIHRDPRAIVASMLALGARDPDQLGPVLSYARHWRKYVAFALRYAGDPLLRDRFHVLRYEDLLRDPETETARLCAALGIDHAPAMLDSRGWIDHATGGAWRGNSSFEPVLGQVDAAAADRWRTSLPAAVLRLVELVCGPEMALTGYEPATDAGDRWPDPDVLAALVEDAARPVSWRSDLGDPQDDYGCELFRRALLACDADAAPAPALVRRSFLFEDVYRQLARREAPAPEVALT